MVDNHVAISSVEAVRETMLDSKEAQHSDTEGPNAVYKDKNQGQGSEESIDVHEDEGNGGMDIESSRMNHGEEYNEEQDDKSDNQGSPNTRFSSRHEETDGPSEKTEVKGESSSTSQAQGEQVAEKKNSRKRLTLQERLALAAKGKGKKVKVPNSSSKRATSEDAPESLTKAEEDNADFDSREVVADYERDELKSKIKSLSTELTNVKIENQELNKRLKSLHQPPSVSDKREVDFIKKIEEKEDTIKQLLQEGEALSLKELKLNDTIKKLRSTISDLENQHSESTKREESASSTVSEIEKLMKRFKVKSAAHLTDKFDQLKLEAEEAKEELSREKEKQWQAKYLEHQQLYNDELEKRKSLSKELNELRIQYDLSKEKNALEMKTKEKIIRDLKRNLVDIKGQNGDEIARLERKIESLRVQNESSHNGTRGETADNGSKSVDYDEYSKLSDNHYTLQQQYLSSQESWKLIESNLMNKVDTLSSSVDLLKRQNAKLSNDLSRVQATLQDKEEEFDENEKKEKILKDEKNELKIFLSLKDEEIAELQEKFDKFKEISNANREDLNRKIQKLQETAEKQRTENSEGGFDDRKLPISGLNLSLEQPKVPLKPSPPNITSESPLQYNSWTDIRFGESSTTPYASKDYSGIFLNPSNNNSRMSFNDNNLDMSSEENYSYGGRNLSLNQNVSGVIPNSSNHNKIQLINKMSSNIRRLEVELSSIKEENSQLSSEKENLEKEILKKWKLADQADERNNQIKALYDQIEEKKTKERQLLELIGEQSERIEELKADIQDLKDLCKLQVQQMIELQESK